MCFDKFFRKRIFRKIILIPDGRRHDDSEALDNLNEFVSNLDSDVLKRKATEDFSEVGAITDTRACKRRRLAITERTEAGAENEFRARSSGIYFLSKKFVNFQNTPKFQVRN